jgi:hypothetical protein
LKKTLTLFTVLVLLVSSTFSVLSLNSANCCALCFLVNLEFRSLPSITINHDGTITPENANITRNGDTYNLTTDLIKQYNIVIKRDNAIFDGGEHFIDVPNGEDRQGIVHSNVGIDLEGVDNVTVRNLSVSAGPYTTGNNCTLERVNATGRLVIIGNFNVVTNCNTCVDILGGSNNLITRNTLSGVYVDVSDKSNKIFENNIYPKADFDSFYHNRFYHDKYNNHTSASWDNGSIGNYWGDYLTKYPNASEIGNTGIGNISYVINPTNIDFHPLMYPISAPQINATYTENATYTDSYPLNFTVNKPIKSACYSLDGADKVTITGNTTLTGIPAGVHNITVYATDIYGFEGASNTVTFTITAQTAVPELFQTVAIAVAIGIIAITAVLDLALWKKKT